MTPNVNMRQISYVLLSSYIKWGIFKILPKILDIKFGISVSGTITDNEKYSLLLVLQTTTIQHRKVFFFFRFPLMRICFQSSRISVEVHTHITLAIHVML